MIEPPKFPTPKGYTIPQGYSEAFSKLRILDEQSDQAVVNAGVTLVQMVLLELRYEKINYRRAIKMLPKRLTALLHQKSDEWHRSDRGRDFLKGMVCQRGCAHCCLWEDTILATDDELDLVAGKLRQTRLRGAQAHPRACPALHPLEKFCMAHGQRPMTCRAFHSTNDRLCSGTSKHGQKHMSWPGGYAQAARAIADAYLGAPIHWVNLKTSLPIALEDQQPDPSAK